jgi:hypothetical protein
MRFGRFLCLALLSAALVVTGSINADASALLVLTDTSGGSVSCNNSLAFSATNCSAATGFTTVANGSFISFTGVVGGYNIIAANIGGNQPGTPLAGNVLNSTFNVLHLQGTGNLQIDYAGNNFSLPEGPTLSLSASASGTWGQSQGTDVMTFQAWGRDDNALTIPGGTATAIAPACVPGAGLTTSCSSVTLDVPFVRGAGFYSLTARQVINQSTGDTLGASYDSSVAAVQVPEPASLLLLGAGLTGIALWRRRSS